MKVYIKKIIDTFILAERSPQRLALSFCLGNSIAWMPLIPFQTPLLLVMAKFLGLNVTVAVAALYLINNPLTMVFFYIADYVFGKWLLSSLFTCADLPNPAIVEHFLHYISRFIDFKNYLGTDTICFWYLLIGGIVLPVVVTLIVYPFVLVFFRYLLTRKIKNNTT